MRETDVYPLEITSLFMLVERAKQQFGTDTCLIPTEAGLEPLSFNDLYDFTIKFAYKYMVELILRQPVFEIGFINKIKYFFQVCLHS